MLDLHLIVCRLPFQSRTLLLEPNKPVKIGRAIARTKVSDNNAIFDCKVLSRNHAELWYDEGKFYLKVSVIQHTLCVSINHQILSLSF
jgi:pSer/pThr/pTyr-binding forkhead associated (FHA) protein